jgi:hypothetical protein
MRVIRTARHGHDMVLARLPAAEDLMVYYFTEARYALDDIKNRRIKLSEIDKLNDPFELWCVKHSDPRIWSAFKGLKEQMSKGSAVLCTSKNYKNPLLWSHYADRHRGICLGLEMDNRGMDVQYRADYLELPPRPIPLEFMTTVLSTKYKDWQYEDEWRGWFSIDTKDVSGFYFYPFDEHIKLRQIFLGPLCKTSNADLLNALEGYRERIPVLRTALSQTAFEVVVNVEAVLLRHK